MKFRSLLTVVSLMAASSLLTAALIIPRASSQDEPMDPAKIEAMYAEAAMPTEHHKDLCENAGTWKTKETMYWGPTPTMSEGSATFEPVLGGRYVIQRYKGMMSGQPFEGFGILGFDKTAGEYFSTWMDTMSTGIAIQRGKPPAAGGVLEMKGELRDVMTPNGRKIRTTLKDVSKDEFRMEMFETMPAGDQVKESKTMEMVYTRVKK